MKRNLSVWVAAFILGLGSTQLATAQAQPVPVPFNKFPQAPKAQPVVPAAQPTAPKTQPATQPAIPGVKVQPQGPIVFPSVLPGGVIQPGGVIRPGGVMQPNVIRPGIVIQPSTPGIVFPVVPQPNVAQPVVPEAPAGGPDRILFQFTNGGSVDMTIHLKYINTDGNVRTLKAERARFAAPGEKVTIPAPPDIATFQDKAETKYLVAISAVREGYSPYWWGVKVQNGKVEDKNEFVGMKFASFTTKANGKETKNLTMTLRPKE